MSNPRLGSGIDGLLRFARNDGWIATRLEIVIPREGGVSSTPRPIGSITDVSGILDRPPSRTMTTECGAVFSRRIASEVCHQLSALLFRGRREDRVHAAPAVSRAICANKSAHEHTGQLGTLRPSPRNGFTAYFVLFPENGSFASVAREKRSLLPDLTPAPRRPNHTTSPYASGAYVYRAFSVHRISPRVRDDRERPSSAVRRAKLCR